MHKKTIILFFLLLFPALALCEGELTVLQSSCSIVSYGEVYRVHCFAQVHNYSDQVVGMQTGSFRVMNGETVIAEEEVDRLWPYFLGPGEDGYVFGTAVFNPDENGNPVVPSVTGLNYTFETMEVRSGTANQQLFAQAEIERMGSGSCLVTCTVENTGEITAYNPVIAFGLYTGSGTMIYADGKQLEQIGIVPGSSIVIRFPISLQLTKQWDDYGVTPDEIKLSASYRADED